MTNIATVLKTEISRIARKEMRSELQQLKSASAQYRSHIASLRRQIKALEQRINKVGKATNGKAARPASADQGGAEVHLRFSAKRLAAQRNRLGLSANSLAALLGVSAQSVYNWETGKSRPRYEQLQAIAAVRKMGKREVAAKLTEVAS